MSTVIDINVLRVKWVQLTWDLGFFLDWVDKKQWRILTRNPSFILYFSAQQHPREGAAADEHNQRAAELQETPDQTNRISERARRWQRQGRRERGQWRHDITWRVPLGFPQERVV